MVGFGEVGVEPRIEGIVQFKKTTTQKRGGGVIVGGRGSGSGSEPRIKGIVQFIKGGVGVGDSGSGGVNQESKVLYN